MTNEFLILITVIVINLLAATVVVMFLKSKTAKFSLVRYFILLAVPGLSLVYVIAQYGWVTLLLFAVFALMGTAIEYVLGYTFYKMCNTKVWEYSLYSWSGFTSWLAIIPWGFYGMSIFGAGVVILQLMHTHLL
jgi:hypothetical protein